MSNILIGFVTPSDPKSPRGLASIATAVRALEPVCVHLLYTEATQDNLDQTERWIQEQPAQGRTEVRKHELCLPDARELTLSLECLRGILPEIRRHSRGLFHLVSGHAVIRLAMALCVASWEIDGVVLTIADPVSPEDEARDTCKKRVGELKIDSIRSFLRDAAEQQASARLRISLVPQKATLDGRSLGIRSYMRDGVVRSAAGDLLTALAARRKYGGSDSSLSSAQLAKAAYGTRSGTATNVWKRIQSINTAAHRVSHQAPVPIDELVVSSAQGTEGLYQLDTRVEGTDIVFLEGESALRDRLLSMDLGDLRVLFPYL